MPKKSPASASASALVHIATPTAGVFSKAQKEFNRLTKRVGNLETELADFQQAAMDLRRRVQEEYRPLQAQHDAQRAEVVPVLDAAYRAKNKLTANERLKIKEMLAQAFFDLPQKGFDQLQPILDRYTPPRAAEADAEDDRLTAAMMQQLFEQQYGLKFDPSVDISSPEKFRAYAEQLMNEQQAAWEAEEAAKEARRAQRKKTPKQQAAEEKKALEEKSVTQAVRTIYRDLVKALHPDREPDEAEKARKTELMQRVTAAYEKNELLTLLRLQLELEHIDLTHLEQLADSQLAPYNKLLREQVRDLEQTLFEEQMAVSEYSGGFGPTSAASLKFSFEWKKRDLQTRVDKLTADVEAMRTDVGAVKTFLKGFRLVRQ